MQAKQIKLYDLVLKYKEAVEYAEGRLKDAERERDIETTFFAIQNFFKGLHD